jgi:hypothetical protein
MPSPKLTYWLAGLVLLGAGYLFFFERHMQTTGESARGAARVLDLSAEDVSRVRIRRDAWTSAVVERVAATEFRVLEPVAGAADGAAISQLLSTLEFLDSRADLEGEAADGKRRREYGLDPPKLEIEVQLASGDEQRLALGADAPLGGGVYARANGGDTVRVVDKGIRELFDQQLDRIVGGPERPDESEGG